MAHILLVDDDEDLIEINRTILAQRGHSVTVAYSAAEAREDTQTIAPDVAVLDVMMEDRTAGIDLARHLHKKFPELHMIMLAGIRWEIGPGLKFKPDEPWLTMTRFLEKPVNPRVLADEVDKLLATMRMVTPLTQ